MQMENVSSAGRARFIIPLRGTHPANTPPRRTNPADTPNFKKNAGESGGSSGLITLPLFVVVMLDWTT